MISRRGFLKTLAGIAPILGSAGLCLSSPLWERLLPGDRAGELFALDPKSDLVRLAPRARFWTSVPLAGADCRQCHPPQEKLAGKRVRHEAGLVKCLLCAQGCGIMNEAPLAELCETLDAIKIDLKGYDETFYRDVCSAELSPVLRSIKQIAKSRAHLEIVNLVVPTLNDSREMLRGLIDWVLGEIGPDVPVHFTRFHPDCQLLNLPPTPVSTLELARETAMGRGMHYAYVGNVPDHSGNNTYCPSHGEVVIKHAGFFIVETNIKTGRCTFCRGKIAGVWS